MWDLSVRAEGVFAMGCVGFGGSEVLAWWIVVVGAAIEVMEVIAKL